MEIARRWALHRVVKLGVLCAVLTPLASTFAAPQRLVPRTPRSVSAGERLFTGRASSAATASENAAEPAAAGSLRHYSMLTLQRVVGVGIFIGVYFLQRLFGSKTPVGGMLLVFFSMLGIEAINPRLAQSVFKFLEPGYRFLVKWLIVFFVPALVRVSLIHVDLGVGGLFRVFVLLLVGWFITFGLTAGVASLFPEPQMEVQPEKEPEQPATPASARLPFMRYFVLMFFAAVAASAGVAEGLDQTVFMMCAALAGFTLGKRLPPTVQKFIHPLFICAGATFGAAALWIVLEHPGLKAMDLRRPNTAPALSQRLAHGLTGFLRRSASSPPTVAAAVTASATKSLCETPRRSRAAPGTTTLMALEEAAEKAPAPTPEGPSQEEAVMPFRHGQEDDDSVEAVATKGRSRRSEETLQMLLSSLLNDETPLEERLPEDPAALIQLFGGEVPEIALPPPRGHLPWQPEGDLSELQPKVLSSASLLQ